MRHAADDSERGGWWSEWWLWFRFSFLLIRYTCCWWVKWLCWTSWWWGKTWGSCCGPKWWCRVKERSRDKRRGAVSGCCWWWWCCYSWIIRWRRVKMESGWPKSITTGDDDDVEVDMIWREWLSGLLLLLLLSCYQECIQYYFVRIRRNASPNFLVFSPPAGLAFLKNWFFRTIRRTTVETWYIMGKRILIDQHAYLLPLVTVWPLNFVHSLERNSKECNRRPVVPSSWSPNMSWWISVTENVHRVFCRQSPLQILITAEWSNRSGWIVVLIVVVAASSILIMILLLRLPEPTSFRVSFTSSSPLLVSLHHLNWYSWIAYSGLFFSFCRNSFCRKKANQTKSIQVTQQLTKRTKSKRGYCQTPLSLPFSPDVSSWWWWWWWFEQTLFGLWQLLVYAPEYIRIQQR